MITMPNAPIAHNVFAKRRRPAEARAGSSARGYDANWQRYREWFASNVRPPVCAAEGCGYAGQSRAMHLDHKRPLKERPDLKYEPTNLQWLCRICHSKKTRSEQG